MNWKTILGDYPTEASAKHIWWVKAESIIWENQTRESLLAFLEFSDPNGCYSDDDRDSEEYEHATKAEALHHINLIFTEGEEA